MCDVLPQKLPSEWAEHCCSNATLYSGTPVVTSCASVKRTDPLVVIVGSFSFFKNMSCVLRRNRQSSGKSPIAHLVLRVSRPRNRHLLCPTPATVTTASRCSCRSPVGPGAVMGAKLTYGSDAVPVLLRPCCSLTAPRAALYLLLEHTPHWRDVHRSQRAPWD